MRLDQQIHLIPARSEDYPVIQNMARFYVYDRTAYMGWECPESGLFECIDFKHYFENTDEKAFLIKVSNEIAGFVLLDKMQLLEPVDWNMGEFFVLAKFQGKGVASTVARQIFNEHPGKWSIAVMPENIKAVNFWRKIIPEASHGDYNEVFKTEGELRSAENPDPHAMNIITFETKAMNWNNELDVKPFEIVKSQRTDAEFIDNNIVEYNNSKVVFLQHEAFKSLNYCIKDDKGLVIAGVNSLMYCWRMLYIDVLFTISDSRAKGFGSRLLTYVEKEAKQLGATLAHLDTFDFQAKDFYIKHGYEVFGVLDDCPQGHKRYYMKKAL